MDSMMKFWSLKLVRDLESRRKKIYYEQGIDVLLSKNEKRKKL
jgi:hypothetical protein